MSEWTRKTGGKRRARNAEMNTETTNSRQAVANRQRGKTYMQL